MCETPFLGEMFSKLQMQALRQNSNSDVLHLMSYLLFFCQVNEDFLLKFSILIKS